MSGAVRLTEEGCRRRQARLRAAIDGEMPILISTPHHVTYLCGLEADPVNFSARGAALLWIQPDGTSLLVADNHLLRRQPEPFVDRVEVARYYDGQRPMTDRRAAVVQRLLELVRPGKGCRIGCEELGLPWAFVRQLRERYPDVELVAVDSTLRALRRRKDPDELAVLGTSMRAIAAGHHWALHHVAPGMSELDVYAGVAAEATKSVGKPVVVYGDFVSGPRTWTDRGGPPTSRRLEAGDFMILDFSVVVSGYRGDYTNTLCVGREPNRLQQELFELCGQALLAGEKWLRPGSTGAQIWQAIHHVLIDADPSFRLPHHAGHGVGLEHPEPPVFGEHSDDVLVEGDVVTLEPGIYLPGVAGIRWERNYLITEQGSVELSSHQLVWGLQR
jgi:Xaa-Pro dipeptidase